ncbi:hypothetical protein NQ314_019767 [Rhamnusium bicolor]|uniref:Regulatory protein zeste n=1 Tax=Rhamnusium bicolor TaxID=1586634 RepID=A0AAV8WMV2_9CUCU|nr:hypothetical protein NQ314_019767 [Rhamnusium bicolor]
MRDHSSGVFAGVANTLKRILKEWVKQHPQLLSGLFSNSYTKKDSQKLWESVTLTLNAVPGASNKTWKQWRKAWADLKKNVKAKNSGINRHQLGTGGGPPLEIKLSDTEKEILSLQVSTSLSGNDNIRESVAIFNYKEVANSAMLPMFNEKQDEGLAEIHNKLHEDVQDTIQINNLPMSFAINEQPPITSTKRLEQQYGIPNNTQPDPTELKNVSSDTNYLQMQPMGTPNHAEVKNIVEKNTNCTTPTGVTPKKKKFTTKSARYEKSLTLTKDLVENTISHKAALEIYYEKKIAIMEKDYKSKLEFRAKKNCCFRKTK